LREWLQRENLKQHKWGDSLAFSNRLWAVTLRDARIDNQEWHEWLSEWDDEYNYL
jgi:hypothetical protein